MKLADRFDARRLPTVAIVGGGFTGAAVAYHLARDGVAAEIVVYEPRTTLGAGLAYDDADPAHRINVPAKRMSLLPGDPDHFVRWLEAASELDGDRHAFWGGEAFPGRAVFGRYVDEHVRPEIEAGRIHHVQARVVSTAKSGTGWIVGDADGAESFADILVIATTHPAPAIPQALAAFADDPRLTKDPLADDALRAIGADDSVLIVGSGLTGVDVVASLEARGYRGAITMISRRGLVSRGPAAETFPAEGDFITEPARSASEILARIRKDIRRAEAQGRSWQCVLDRVREQGQAIWLALTPDARLRIVRRLRPFWDVHRFRAAPMIHALIERKRFDGSLTLMKARIGDVSKAPEGFAVRLVDARGRKIVEKRFEHIVVAVGPAHGAILASQPYLSNLAAGGHVAIDPTGLGLWTDRAGRALNRSGEPSANLFVAGPLARGAFGELMGLPQVSVYAEFIAREIRAELAATAAALQ
jgi:uncharacterized NAD(P)/FAD-binding protein YdhS